MPAPGSCRGAEIISHALRLSGSPDLHPCSTRTSLGSTQTVLQTWQPHSGQGLMMDMAEGQAAVLRQRTGPGTGTGT